MSLPTLRRHADRLGVSLDDGQVAAFDLYRDELLESNRRVNLTAVTDPAEVELRHFVDSLWCLTALKDLLDSRPDASMIDIGTGAGFPGLPLKLVCPRIRLTLVDSVRKKTVFLEQLVARLQLSDVRVLTGRAEDLGQTAAEREVHDVALSRALARLPVLLELCLPLVKPGGRLVAPRRGNLLAQQAEADPAARLLGGCFRMPQAVDLGPEYSDYGLVVVDKVASSPTRYPRPAGLPAKKPILRRVIEHGT
jgi:16S rRNA (guanine527-N7)-methyltransferase